MVELPPHHLRLCDQLGHRFADESLLHEALAHRSRGAVNYERLEFLGDSLLNFVIADELCQRHVDLAEGTLSRMRASIVCGSALAEVARDLALGDYLLLGTGELKSGGYQRDSILADVVESLLGAVLRDAGFSKARTVVLHLLGERLDTVLPVTELKDPKTRLQELLQGKGLERPLYQVVKTTGKSHEPEFTVTCSIPSITDVFEGVSTSRRRAEQAAAEAALEATHQWLTKS